MKRLVIRLLVSIAAATGILAALTARVTSPTPRVVCAVLGLLVLVELTGDVQELINKWRERKR